MSTWKVSAQVEGGKRETGTITAPPDATRDYVLKRFLNRRIFNASRVDFWYYKNKDTATVQIVRPEDKPSQKTANTIDRELDKELPAPDFTNWPAMIRNRKK